MVNMINHPFILAISLMWMCWSSLYVGQSHVPVVKRSLEKREKVRRNHTAPPVSRNGFVMRYQRDDMIQLHDYPQSEGLHDYISVLPDKPRVIFLEQYAEHRPARQILDPMDCENQTQVSHHRLLPYEGPYHRQCTYMEKWQQQFYPTCNQVHELSGESVSILSLAGSWRSAWKARSGNETIVLKMLQLNHDFDHETFKIHQIDAMATERLSSSPFVVTSYGFCGQSTLVEWAPNDARSILKDGNIGSLQRLRMARDLARGLNHIHSIDKELGQLPSLCHNDINVANIVNVNKQTLKFNDFNLAVLLKWNKTEPCGYPVTFRGDLWRSPEEVRNTTYVSEKTDIYALGNVLYQVLTKHQPWTWIERDGPLSLEQVAKRKLEGLAPMFSDKILNSTKLAQIAMYYGTLACYNPNPLQRPTAHHLSKGFHQAIQWIKAKRKVSKEELERLFAFN